MISPEVARLLRVARRDLKMARRLVDPDVEEASWGWATQQCLQEAGVDITELLPLRAFSTFAVQCRYDDEPDELGLDRTAWCTQAEAGVATCGESLQPLCQRQGQQFIHHRPCRQVRGAGAFHSWDVRSRMARRSPPPCTRFQR